MDIEFTFIINCIALAAITFFSVVYVHTGMAYTIECLGKYKYTLKPGLHFIVPFLCRVVHKLSIMEQSLKIPLPETTTEDGKRIKIEGSITFQIVDIEKAAYRTKDLSKSLKTMAEEIIKTILEERTLLEIQSERGKIDAILIKTCNTASMEWGTKTIAVELGYLDELK